MGSFFHFCKISAYVLIHICFCKAFSEMHFVVVFYFLCLITVCCAFYLSKKLYKTRVCLYFIGCVIPVLPSKLSFYPKIFHFFWFCDFHFISFFSYCLVYFFELLANCDVHLLGLKD